MNDELPAEVRDALASLRSHYDFDRADDRGASGYTFFASNAVTEQEVVIKFYSAAEDRRHDEPRLLAKVNSANVLRILDARAVSEEWAYFITPKCSGGDLDDRMRSGLSALEALDAALHICSGVSAIHAAGLVHRDLKPGNIVVEDNIPLIADFGSVRQLGHDGAGVNPSRHSILFRPPECFGGGLYTLAGDVYQIGLITYQLMGGQLDYDGLSHLKTDELRAYEAIADDVDRSLFVDAALQRRIQTGTLVRYSTLPPWFVSSAAPLLRRLLAIDPALRLTSSADVAAALLSLRNRSTDWRRVGEIIVLDWQGGTIELHPLRSGEYEAFRVSRGRRRRAPGSPKGKLAALVKQYS